VCGIKHSGFSTYFQVLSTADVLNEVYYTQTTGARSRKGGIPKDYCSDPKQRRIETMIHNDVDQRRNPPVAARWSPARARYAALA
jgi:hypothetical protein